MKTVKTTLNELYRKGFEFQDNLLIGKKRLVYLCESFDYVNQVYFIICLDSYTGKYITLNSQEHGNKTYTLVR